MSSRLPALLRGSRGRFVSFYNSRPCNTSWIRVPKPAKQGGHCLKRGFGDSLYVMSQRLRSSWVKTALLPAGSRAALLKRLYSRLRFSPPQTRKTRRDTTVSKIFRSCSERGTANPQITAAHAYVSFPLLLGLCISGSRTPPPGLCGHVHPKLSPPQTQLLVFVADSRASRIPGLRPSGSHGGNIRSRRGARGPGRL